MVDPQPRGLLGFVVRHKLALLVAVCAATRLTLAFTAHGLNADGPKFAMAARRMAEEGLTEGMKGDRMWPYYPVNARLVTYPFLGSLVYRIVGDPVLALRIVSALSGAALAAVTYVLAREVLKREGPAFLAGAVVGLETEFTRASASVYREPLAAVICVMAFYLLLRMLRAERRWPAWAAATGAVLFVGFITRVEFAVLAAVFCAAALIKPSPSWKRRLLMPALICLTMAALELPYYLWLRKETGRYVLNQWQLHRLHPDDEAVDRFLTFQGEEP